MFVADGTDGVELDFILPPGEGHAFSKTFASKGIKAVFEAVAAMKVEDAKASVPSDRDRILEMVRKGPGFRQLNKVVVERVQQVQGVGL